MLRITEKFKRKNINVNNDSPVKIAFLGDSVTHGCFETDEKGNGVIDCTYDNNSVYHTLLKKRLEAVFPKCPVSVINAGISGGGAKDGYNRLSRDILSVNPDLVVVCFGLNDVHGREAGLEEYLRNMKNILCELKDKNIEAVVMTPNMMCTYLVPQICDALKGTANACAELQNGGMMDRYMDSLKSLCAELQIPVCDCYNIWKNMEKTGADIPWLLSNHINHPTRELHELFASELFRLIIG